MASRRSLIWAFVPLCACYLYFSPYFEKLNNPNENVRLYLVRSLVDHGTLSIDPVLREWGYVNDQSAFRGHRYSAKAPGTSLSAVPVYFLQKHLFRLLGIDLSKARVTYAARLFAVVLPTLLFLWFLGRFLERRGASPHTRDLTVLGLGLGTPLLAYGTIFVAHAQVVVCAFGSFMAARSAADLDWEGLAPRHAVAWRLALGGFLAGWATLTEYQVALVSVLLLLYVAAKLRHRARTLWFCLGAFPVAVLLFGYNYLCFDGLMEFSYAHLENSAFSVNAATGLMGFTDVKPGVLLEILFGATNGLFYFSPLLLLGVAGCFATLRRRPFRLDGVLMLLVFAVMASYLSGNVAWRAGWSIGPRYITVVDPFLAYGVALLLIASESSWARWPVSALASGLAVVSIGISAVAVVYPHYPPGFQNPTFELAWPLVLEGYLPYSGGWLLGLHRRLALLPLVPFLGLALYLVLAGGGTWRQAWGRRTAHALGAAAIAAGLLIVASQHTVDTPGQRRVAHNVRLKWEPQDGLPKLSAPPLPRRPTRRVPRTKKPARKPAPSLGLLRQPGLPPPSRSPDLVPRLRRPVIPERLGPALGATSRVTPPPPGGLGASRQRAVRRALGERLNAADRPARRPPAGAPPPPGSR